jgi:hypothetical protein
VIDQAKLDDLRGRATAVLDTYDRAPSMLLRIGVPAPTVLALVEEVERLRTRDQEQRRYLEDVERALVDNPYVAALRAKAEAGEGLYEWVVEAPHPIMCDFAHAVGPCDCGKHRLITAWEAAGCALHPELVQVGWYCNEAINNAERTSICGHPAPCGPTYVKRQPEAASAGTNKGEPR